MLGSNLDIMSPQWTNVVFKDRNQAYGAYQLRRDNSSTTMRALFIAGSLFILLLSAPTIANIISGFIPKADTKYVEHIVKLLPPPSIAKDIPKPPVLPQKQVQAQHSTVIFPPPVVVPHDTEIEPPTDAKLQLADPGQKNLHGNDNAAVVIDEPVGPVDRAGAVTEDPKEVFTAVEINPMYPGGEGAFGKFLHDHIRYPGVAKETGTQGRVFVSFIVETDGSLTDMKVLRDPGSGLGEEAVRVLKSSPHWTAGIQNGKKVRVQFTVPINFTLAE